MAEKTITCPVDIDSYTENYPNPNKNFGNSDILKWGKDAANVYRNAFIKYNLSAYPYGTDSSPIISAVMYVYQYYRKDNAVDVPIYRITSNWQEDTITHNNMPSTDVTVELGTINSGTNGWKSLDITNLVKKWIDGTYNNYGIRIYNGSITNVRGYSSEYSDSLYRPYLTITYKLKPAGILVWWFCKDSWEKHDKIWKPKILKPEFEI